MTEEIIKECKNCDALGIDSEIGVYYCCLSHRQDDLPKEFTCNDFTPNKQLKRLEQENKQAHEDFICSDTALRIANTELDELKQENSLLSYNLGLKEGECDKLEQENKELKEKVKELDKMTGIFSARLCDKYRSALEEILESAKFAQCLPCGSGNLEDCLNCDDDTTNNGQFCMEKRIHEIKTKCVEVLNHQEG